MRYSGLMFDLISLYLGAMIRIFRAHRSLMLEILPTVSNSPC